MPAIAALTFRAAKIPTTAPIRVPITPITVPWTMKMSMICPGVAPRVRRMAMSPRLSLTTITRVEMMLNAATATISSNSRPIMAFSIRIAWYRLPWVRVQSRL
ncbi:hypothetical protein D9M73_169590 [compost metagenome]